MTMQLELIPTLKPAMKRPVEPIVRSAEIEGSLRFVARRGWGAGPALGIAMLNPSNADGERDDPTMWSCMKHACRLGFGSIVVVNIYPFITPQPSRLQEWLREAGDAREQIIRNRHVAAGALKPCAKVMFAWGNGVPKPQVDAFIEHLVIEMCDGNVDEPGPEIVFYCLGTNQDGSPRHPLARGRNRIPDDQKLVAWKP